MQGVFDAAKHSILHTTKSCLSTSVCKDECMKLGRYVGKVALLLSELELQLHTNDKLKGEKPCTLFTWCHLMPFTIQHPLPWPN